MHAVLQISAGVPYPDPINTSRERYCRVWISSVKCLCWWWKTRVTMNQPLTEVRHEYTWGYQHLNRSIQWMYPFTTLNVNDDRIFVFGWAIPLTLWLSCLFFAIHAKKTPDSPPSRRCPGQLFSPGSYQRLAAPGGWAAGFPQQS